MSTYDWELWENAIKSTDGDYSNLFIKYYFNRGSNFTEEEKEYMNKNKNKYLIFLKGIDDGLPMLWCGNYLTGFSSKSIKKNS